MATHHEQPTQETNDRIDQVTHELNLRDQIRQDAALSGAYGGLYPRYGHPGSLQELGFGAGRYAPELSQLRYKAGAERGLYTAAEESENLLERYRRERHQFLPMAEERNGRANKTSRVLEPVKSVATRVAEQRKLEERLVHRSYNPYFAGALPANASGYYGGEMRLAHDKVAKDELAIYARARSVEGDPRAGPESAEFNKHIHSLDMKTQEDCLRQMHVLAPTQETLREAYAFRY
eukprot:TRINITY_DN43272_c0_g1_i1.p2 TRINITY_DN43272_c0_g1~~TRINITY_DN43272_c0_g1_i1.p2  ORF type:complete len:235 (-),score=49.03 TRINITY_DN43272_c0_g1_i1:172-876(-)